jgi:hypothetical protein
MVEGYGHSISVSKPFQGNLYLYLVVLQMEEKETWGHTLYYLSLISIYHERVFTCMYFSW